jgi:hypothetical protein
MVSGTPRQKLSLGLLRRNCSNIVPAFPYFKSYKYYISIISTRWPVACALLIPYINCFQILLPNHPTDCARIL